MFVKYKELIMAQQILSTADAPIYRSYVTGSSMFEIASGVLGFQNNSLGLAKLSAGTGLSTQFLTGAGGWAAAAEVTGTAGGDLAGTFPNPSIAASAITSAKLGAGSVSVGKISASGSPSLTTFLSGAGVWEVPSLTGSAGGSLAGTYPNPSIAAAAIGTSNIVDGSLTVAKLSATGTPSSTTFLAGNGAWQVVSVLTGTAGGSLTGTYPNPTIAAGVITSTMIPDGTIDVSKNISNSTTHTVFILDHTYIASVAPSTGITVGPVIVTANFPSPVSGSSALPTNSLLDRTISYQYRSTVNGNYQGQICFLYVVPEIAFPVITGVAVYARVTVAGGSSGVMSARITVAATGIEIASVSGLAFGASTAWQTLALTVPTPYTATAGQLLSVELYPTARRSGGSITLNMQAVRFTYSAK